MVVPIQRAPLPGTGAAVAATRPLPDVQQPASVRRFTRSYPWIVIGLAVVAVLSRIYTTNSLLGEPIWSSVRRDQ